MITVLRTYLAPWQSHVCGLINGGNLRAPEGSWNPNPGPMHRPPSTTGHPPHSTPSRAPSTPHPQWWDQISSPIPAENTAHPAQVALRTYCLALCLSLGPSLIPFLTSRGSAKTSKNALKRVLAREFGLGGFAFSFTLAVGGGSFIRSLWKALDDLDSNAPENSTMEAAIKLRSWISVLKLSSVQKTFLSNAISSSAGLLLLQAGRSRSQSASRSKEPSASRTLDLTLLLLVRALDAAVQSFVAKKSGSRRESDAELPVHHAQMDKQWLRSSLKREAMRTQIDSLVFWACSARYVTFFPCRICLH